MLLWTLMDERFEKAYSPNETEDRIYALWEKSGFFNPDTCVEENICSIDAEAFSIVLPPPNVTGTLHIGHAMMLVVEDIMVRYNRMRGKKTLWIPGTDHAAIATESKVAKLLAKKGVKRHELGREKFLEKVNAFAQESHDTITHQVKKMGASLDWSREAYTLDDTRQRAVYTAFKKMYNEGLIYRGYRIVNWDPKGQTTISDDEVVHEERPATMYYFKYASDFPITIATTRPETKLGDTAVAVHPDDDRYKEYVGKEYTAVFAGEEITVRIVADESVDKELGTGALGVTPAHSAIDEEIAKRHDLRMKQVINEYGKMTVGMEGVKDVKVDAAREAVVNWLKEENLLEKEEAITHNVSTAERTGGTVEPLPKEQWFIDVNKKFPIPHSEIPSIETGQEVTLKELMLHVVREGHIKILPKRFEKVYYHWIENLRDWNISRQIWFGHRIPVWYKNDEIHVDTEPPKGDGWQQDEDTLDTWFSSGLWTFSTLGWPNKTSDLQTYHPTNVLETGYDILFFWVARMILMSTYLLGQVPFRTVYLHGLVRDGKGRKMSKSLGNIVDPLDTIETYGADATRMSLIVGIGAGNDSNLSEDKIRAYKKFANKLWNITRFILSNTEDYTFTEDTTPTDTDKKLLDTLNALVADVTEDFENYRYYLAGEKMYHYVWHTLADVILEESKDILNGDDVGNKESRQNTLIKILRICLQTLHPFMPFVTEEIWQQLKSEIRDQDVLMVSKWPTTK